MKTLDICIDLLGKAMDQMTDSFKPVSQRPLQQPAQKRVFPLDFVVLLVLAAIIPGLQPPREMGPFHTVTYIEHLYIYLPGLLLMAALCVSIARNKRRARLLRIIALFLLLLVTLCICTPLKILISVL